MSNKQSEIQGMSRTQLHERLLRLAKIEREVLHEIILIIKEIDNRSLHLEMGYPSLFDYLTTGIGYSEGSAQRRIDAVRLSREVPDLLQNIATGHLKLSQVSLVQKSAREAHKIHGTKISSDMKKDLLTKIQGSSARESEYKISQHLNLPVKYHERQKVQSNQSVRIEMTLSQLSYAKVVHAQNLISHALPQPSITSYVEYLTDRVLKQKAPSLTHRRSKNASEEEEAKEPEDEELFGSAELLNNPEEDLNREYLNMQEGDQPITDRVRRLMIALYKNCQYQDPKTGRTCGSQWQLQVDHIQPLWAGGQNHLDNYRLLCARHNQWKYKKEANIQRIEAAPF